MEPKSLKSFAGVDPVSRRALWEILMQRKSDLAILLVTHYIDEADILSDQVCLNSARRLGLDDPIVKLQSSYEKIFETI